ncbi:MAG: glutamine synthetase family protein [Dongiaceae bacterium]
MTDLERYMSQDAREEQIRQVRARINETGVTYIYYQYVSITGRIMGKGAPADHWEAMAKKGVQTWIGGLTNVLPDRSGKLIGFGPNTHELLAMPDPDTFCQLPWEKRTGRVFCTVFHMREDPKNPGGYMTGDSRGNLRRAHEKFGRDHDGLQMRHGCEPEMMWLNRGEDGGHAGGPTKPLAYHIDQFEELAPVYLKVIDYARAMGLDMIQGDHEDAPGQLELNFMFDDALRTADRLTTYRQICRRVAREFNLIACFMTKPFMKMSANGCHHNISLWSGGEDRLVPLGHDPLPGANEVFTYRQGGTNEFIDASKPGAWLPPPIGRHAVGGMLKHLVALTAIGASTVNSYRRMMDTGLWAPVFADWGFQNRTCALRVSAPGRMEYRSVDSMVNPYLMASALLAAMDDGLKNKIDPGEPEERNIYEAMEAGKQVKRLPSNLGAALDGLAADEVVKSALPGDMYRLYELYKRDEWDSFNATVSNWDVERYLDCLP